MSSTNPDNDQLEDEFEEFLSMDHASDMSDIAHAKHISEEDLTSIKFIVQHVFIQISKNTHNGLLDFASVRKYLIDGKGKGFP